MVDMTMHPTPIRALFIEDTEDDALILQRVLIHGGFHLMLECVETAAAMQAALAGGEWDVILSDFNMPRFGAPEALALLQASGLDIPFIVVSGTIGEETAVEMMRAGAADYVMKGNLRRVVPAIRRELQEAVRRREHRLVEAALREQEQKNEAMQERSRIFLQDVLAAVTDGKLRLCHTSQDLPVPLAGECDFVPLVTDDALRELRHQSRNAAQALGFTEERSDDLIMAVSEAGMNAIVHAGGGAGRVYRGPDTVQVWIEDNGKGIAVEHLPRATLERGYTTAGTLGFGMKIMLTTTDRIWLLTGLSGTTVVLEQDRTPFSPAWLP